MAETNKRIEQLADEIEETHQQSEISPRLATIPGVGVFAATTPDVGNFDSARDYAAWLGRISKMGNRYIRRLLYLGAMAWVSILAG